MIVDVAGDDVLKKVKAVAAEGNPIAKVVADATPEEQEAMFEALNIFMSSLHSKLDSKREGNLLDDSCDSRDLHEHSASSQLEFESRTEADQEIARQVHEKETDKKFGFLPARR